MLYRRKTLLSIKPAEDKNVPLMRKRVAQGGTEGKRKSFMSEIGLESGIRQRIKT